MTTESRRYFLIVPDYFLIVPDEVALQLHDLELAVVHFGDDRWPPLFAG
jgi:hypothetical protein